MEKKVKIYHIVCEGSSEVAYLNELNKYIREAALKIVLVSHNLNGISSYNKIRNDYLKVRKHVKNKKNTDDIFIWLDNDVFKREKLSKNKLQQILMGFSGIKYNYENFEDFLVMHLSDEKIREWRKICIGQNHFNIPMNGEVVEKLIKSIIPDYLKGSLPKEIQSNLGESLIRLYENQKNSTVEFRSDFADVIKQLLKIPN